HAPQDPAQLSRRRPQRAARHEQLLGRCRHPRGTPALRRHRQAAVPGADGSPGAGTLLAARRPVRPVHAADRHPPAPPGLRQAHPQPRRLRRRPALRRAPLDARLRQAISRGPATDGHGARGHRGRRPRDRGVHRGRDGLRCRGTIRSMVVTRQRRAVGAGAAASTAPAHGDDASRGTVLALAQIAPRLGDVATNLQRHLAIISEAENAGAGMVVFPELSLTGYFLKDLVPDVALRVDSSELAALAAASLTVGIVTGCVLETDDARFYNAALLFSGGELRHVHRKVYLPTYGIF